MKKPDSSLKTRDGEPIAFWIRSSPAKKYKHPSGDGRIIESPASESQVYVGGMSGKIYQKSGIVSEYLV